MRKFLYILLDLCIAGAVMGGLYIKDYKLPEKGISAVAAETEIADAKIIDSEASNMNEHFTKDVISTDTSYSSPDLSVELSYFSYDTGVQDTSAGGKHLKYGTGTSYVLADIYVTDVNQIKTVFADDTYGVGHWEKISDMSDRMKAVLAVNGDAYSNDHNKDNGTVIRNGVLYRAGQSLAETCILYGDGSMAVQQPGEVDEEQLIADGAWQTWIFGPSLLDENGKAKTDFITWDYIKESHPRTAIGYYEPGHYCLLVADGRKSTTRGLFLEEEAAIFEKLGCKLAYNLDGGHSSFMVFNGKTASHPYKEERKVPDGIIFTEGNN